MKHSIYSVSILAFSCILLALNASCSDTETYAELVDAEKNAIGNFIRYADISARHVDEDWVNRTTKAVLEEGEHPQKYVELNEWYTIDEGDFKRLYFKIKDWGNIDSSEFKANKFKTGSNALVRYDSCYNLGTFVDFETDKGNNLDPNSYEIIYSWRSDYYANTYYAVRFGTGSNYECTSGGLAFPLRFLWYGGEAAVIVPFSLGSSSDQTYYLTCYYGSVKYTRPTFLPE